MQELLAVMRELREKCPWDQAQTPESLTKYAIEEAYELEAAVRSGQQNDIRDELGDLLLQVVFQSQMYSEQGVFDFQDVVQAITEKLIRRHPHVFQAEQFGQLSPADVATLWQKIKTEENKHKPKSYLADIKPAPALDQAQQIQQRAAKIGFDFETVQQAYGKLEEELAELQQAIAQQNANEIEEEFGDSLFSLINVGRKLGLNSEAALLGTIHKFRSRFAYIEHQALQQNKNIEQMTLQEMDQFWDEAKIHLKQNNKHDNQSENPESL